MALNGTMVRIQTVTVAGGGSPTIEFTNIPQIYDDLQIFVSARSTRATLEDGLGVRLNNITSGYTYRNITASGSSVASANTNFEQTWSGRIPAANSTGSIFSNNIIYISNYRSNTAKSYMADSVAENNSTTAYLVLEAIINTTTDAISSITLNSLNANLESGSTATLYGISRTTAQIKATGGMVYDDASYVYHLFTTSGTFTPLQNLSCDYLVVAGGGGGGGWYGGGGGAGGLRSTVGATGGGGSLESALSLTASTAYTVTVGAGGASQTQGSSSVFNTITSTGGGRGGSYESNSGGGSGGSGGGAGSGNGSGVWLNAGTGTANQGYNGGAGNGSNSGSPGGGGAGAAAANAASSPNGTATDGGVGVLLSTWSSATSTGANSGYYAGGGGGGSTVGGGNGAYAGVGGLGGGGAGSLVANSGTGVAGTANTGGGGGGSGYNVASGGAGGSGIVIVRYAK
jgi:hypothetical protein